MSAEEYDAGRCDHAFANDNVHSKMNTILLMQAYFSQRLERATMFGKKG
jgi:hypothetical protein